MIGSKKGDSHIRRKGRGTEGRVPVSWSRGRTSAAKSGDQILPASGAPSKSLAFFLNFLISNVQGLNYTGTDVGLKCVPQMLATWQINMGIIFWKALLAIFIDFTHSNPFRQRSSPPQMDSGTCGQQINRSSNRIFQNSDR